MKEAQLGTPGWLPGWLAGWLATWLPGLLAAWLAGYLDMWPAGWLAGWLAGWGLTFPGVPKRPPLCEFNEICDSSVDPPGGRVGFWLAGWLGWTGWPGLGWAGLG